MHVPFAMGQDESISPVEMPSGPLREATNVRQRRFHSFGVRPDYPAVSMSEYGGTVVPYDVYELNAKLVVLGDRQSRGRPTDLFTLVNQGPGNWRGTAPTPLSYSRVPPVTRLRNVGRVPDATSAISVARVAAVNGVACVAYGTATITAGGTTFFRVFVAATDATLANGAITNLGSARVVAVGTSFWVIGVNSASDLVGARFNVTSATGFSAPVTLYTGTVTNNCFDAVAVKNVAATEFAIIVRDGATTTIRRFNEAGVQQQTFSGPAVAADVLTIEADAVQNRIVVAYRVGAADAFLQTYNLTTGVTTIGADVAMFGEAVSGELYIQRLTSGANGMILCSEDSAVVVRRVRFDENAPAGNPVTRLVNYTICGRGIACGGYVLMPLFGGTCNQIVALLDDVLSQADTRTMVGASVDAGIADAGPASRDGVKGGDTCIDASTGKAYWCRLATGSDGQTLPFISELTFSSTARRRSCQIGNALLIAGSMPLYFDGMQVSEMNFAEKPMFNPAAALTGGGAGSLLPLGQYDYVAVWKHQDALDQVTVSRISSIQSITLTGAQTSVTADVYAAHTLRRDAVTTGSIVIELYRTHCDIDATTGAVVKGTVFQRCAVANVSALSDFGQSVSIIDSMSDATLLSQPPLYTNAERGALSTILEHEAPPPFDFCCTVGNRVFIGGLPDRSEVRISKELFIGESVGFTFDSAFSARVEGDVTQVACLGLVPIAFTIDAVYAFASPLPDDNGNNGALGQAQVLPIDEGCANPDSVCATSAGVFYQSRSGKLMLLAVGASSAVWVGKRVQNTLEAFPTITGAAYVEVDNVVCFTCQNLAGNASTILVFDLLINQWYRDVFASAQIIRAADSYQGRLVYIDTAAVRLQSLSLVPAAFIPMTIKTGSLNPFGGDGTGRLPSVTVPYEFRGDARLRLSISYDDGRTFSAWKTFEFTIATGWVVGQIDRVQWWPGIVKGRSYVLLWEVLAPTSGAASEGLILQRYTLELEGVRPNRARLASAKKG